MRITHVECHRVKAPAADPPFVWRDGLPGSGPAQTGAVLRIVADDGHEGVAFLPSRAAILEDVLDRILRDELIGADPLQREWLWHRV
ncbi:MAG: hypothetical protein JF587_03740 [Catenulisporales bacterium]|nr:hypothetical protein [Catenulisporales bacterium]